MGQYMLIFVYFHTNDSISVEWGTLSFQMLAVLYKLTSIIGGVEQIFPYVTML